MPAICPDCPNLYDCVLTCQREKPSTLKIPIHDTSISLVYLGTTEDGLAEFNAITRQGAKIVQVERGGRLTVRVSPNLSMRMGVKSEGLNGPASTEEG